MPTPPGLLSVGLLLGLFVVALGSWCLKLGLGLGPAQVFLLVSWPSAGLICITTGGSMCELSGVR